MLMLDIWREFNVAVIMAAGGESKLPKESPRPVLVHHSSPQTEFFQRRQLRRRNIAENGK